MDMLDKVANLQEQYDKARLILENQERQIIQFLMTKNRELIEDNRALRCEVKSLRSENHVLLQQNQFLSCDTVGMQSQFIRPYQTENFMNIPGDTSPRTYYSPTDISLDSIHDEGETQFPEYAQEVLKVLQNLRKQVTRDTAENKMLTQKVADLKSLNEQLWSEIGILRKRQSFASSVRHGPRPNTPSSNLLRLSTPVSHGIFSSMHSPTTRDITPKAVGDSPDGMKTFKFFN